jgi:capsular exopolysaccharide synthesis family protein
MKDLIRVPPSDPGFQLMEPMGAGPAPAAPKFQTQKLLYFLRKFWWIPVVTVTLSLGTAITIFFFTPPTFVSYGSLLETAKLQIPDGAAFTEDRDTYLGTQSDLLRSPHLRELTLNWMRAVGTNQISLDANGDPLPVDIEVFTSPKSTIYTVQASSANPAFTPQYLDALMSVYLEYRKNIRQQVSGDTLASISEQVQRLGREMKADQATLDEYSRSNNLDVLQEESTVEANYLSKLRTELSDYQLELKLLAARELEADSTSPDTSSDTSRDASQDSDKSSDTMFESLRNSGAAVSSSSGRMDADKEIELLQIERDRLSKYLLPKHPKIIKLDEQIAHAQKLVEFYHKQNHEQIAAAREVLKIKIDGVQEFINEWEAKVASANERIATADTLKQNVARNQVMYDRLSALLQNVDISRNIDQETLAILEPASPATRSYKEAKTMLSQSAIVGLGLGLGIIFLITIRDDRFNSLVEVTEKFGDNVVGQVPEIAELSEAGPLVLLQDNDDRHMFAESYRNLRSALLYLLVDGKRPRVLLITSAVPNEGKSTVATNLARAIALGGSKVLLVDADLRRGHIHERLGLKSKPGLNELLRQPEVPYDFFIQATDLPNFFFLSRGSVSRNPGDLFLNPAFDQMLARFREQYDYVLIDSSPVFAADDSSTLAPKVDGTLFVVRSRFSHARAVREALELLFQRQAKVLGLVLNRSDATARSYYSYKYAEYYAVNTEMEDKDT